MSYRSLKRVLGETNLERKCLILFGACLFSLITGSFWWYSSQTERAVYEASQRTGRGLVAVQITLQHWKKLSNDAMVKNDKFKDLEQNFADQPYKARFISIAAASDDKPQDEFEYETLKHFAEHPPKPAHEDTQAARSIEAAGAANSSGQENVDAQKGPDGVLTNWDAPTELVEFAQRREKGEYQYYQAIRLKSGSACFSCHRDWEDKPKTLFANDSEATQAKWEAGDLFGMVQIALPDGDTRKALAWNRAILLTTAIITVFLAMVASYLIVRYVIVKPLKHLRDVSDEISRGNVSLRADIHTGDEFEDLGAAFNRMLRNLTNVQEELRKVNSDLDLRVDELAQANMKLFEMNRLKSDFLATMSHELRTPLNAIIGFSDVLGSISSLDDKQKRYVRNIQTSGKVLLEMINDILDLAKIESGKMEVRLGEFRIDQVLAALCDMKLPATERKNIDLIAECQPALEELFQDKAKVQQILENLLSNAIKFTPEGGRIVVRAERTQRGDLLLTVADTGVGISVEDQQIIFEKFRQGKSVLGSGDAMTREYSGTGLGLSIVKELCKLLGGEISLESELGKGSTFTVRLPWSRADLPNAERPADDAKPRRSIEESAVS